MCTSKQTCSLPLTPPCSFTAHSFTLMTLFVLHVYAWRWQRLKGKRELCPASSCAFLGPFPLLTRRPELPSLPPLPPAICLKDVAPQFFTGSHRPLLLQQPPAAAGPSPFSGQLSNTRFLAFPCTSSQEACVACFSLFPLKSYGSVWGHGLWTWKRDLMAEGPELWN